MQTQFSSKLDLTRYIKDAYGNRSKAIFEILEIDSLFRIKKPKLIGNLLIPPKKGFNAESKDAVALIRISREPYLPVATLLYIQISFEKAVLVISD